MQNEIIVKNTSVKLDWRHNLKHGSIPKIIKDQIEINKLEQFAQNVIKLLNIKFATIDIISSNGKYFLLEVNGGVSMDKFIPHVENGYKIVKKIYEEAVLNMFSNIDL